MPSKEAIKHLVETGNLEESVGLALGRNQKTITEQGSRQQTQTWFLPDQDALNQFILRLLNRLPDVTYDTQVHSNNGQGGFAVTVTGVYDDHDLASLASVKGGVMRLDNPPAYL